MSAECLLCCPDRWLLLEFCNRGCISDAVEKGWFRQQPPAVLLGDEAGAGSSVSSSFSGGLSCPAPDLAAILATAREVAAAMSYLHHKNMLHGDLTGNNVLLTAAPAEQRGYTAKVRSGRGSICGWAWWCSGHGSVRYWSRHACMQGVSWGSWCGGYAGGSTPSGEPAGLGHKAGVTDCLMPCASSSARAGVLGVPWGC